MKYYDSHCHLAPDITNTKFNNEVIPILESLNNTINLMMTNHIDEKLIISILNNPNIVNNEHIMVNMGIHPWYTHLYTFLTKFDYETDDEFKKRHYEDILEKYSNNEKYSHPINDLLGELPMPINIIEKIEMFEGILKKDLIDKRLNIGEIGIDKLARIPNTGYLGNPESSKSGLSNYKVNLEHQIRIFKLFLNLGVKYDKKFSIHCVSAHGQIFQILKSLNGKDGSLINCVMHSYSGSLDHAKTLLNLKNIKVWFGLSDIVNLYKYEENNHDDNSHVNDKLQSLLDGISDRVLVETDLGIDRMGPGYLKYIQKVVKKLGFFELKEDKLLDNWYIYNNL